jgi:DNA-binding NarL/FixJ family response regulator
VTRTVTVVIGDDHPPTRAGIRSVLEQRGFVIVAEVANAPAAVEACLALQPDICLLDIHMPGSGIAAASDITSALPATAVVMLTVSRTDEDLFDALRAGASGYLLKGMDPARVADALLGVLDGDAALPRALVARLVDEFRKRDGRRRLPLRGGRGVTLTSREWEVLELLRTGLATAEIAERLFISKGTVRSHVAAILRKLDAPNRAAALGMLGTPTGGEAPPAAS